METGDSPHGGSTAAVRASRYEQIRGILKASGHFDAFGRIYALVATGQRAEEALEVERDRLRGALEQIAAYPEIPHLEKYADWAEVRRIAREALS